MSEKKRQKKDREDMNKNNRLMREAGADINENASGKLVGREGRVKKQHGIDSVRSGYSKP